jgi:hypothetical protein
MSGFRFSQRWRCQFSSEDGDSTSLRNVRIYLQVHTRYNPGDTHRRTQTYTKQLVWPRSNCDLTCKSRVKWNIGLIYTLNTVPRNNSVRLHYRHLSVPHPFRNEHGISMVLEICIKLGVPAIANFAPRCAQNSRKISVSLFNKNILSTRIKLHLCL